MRKKKMIAICAVALILFIVLVIVFLKSCVMQENIVLDDECPAISQNDYTSEKQPKQQIENDEEKTSESNNLEPDEDIAEHDMQQLLFVEEICTLEDNSIIIDIKTLMREGQDISDIFLVSLDGSQNGAITDNGDGTFTYTPEDNYFGSDTLSFTILDSTGKETTASLGIVVSSVNDAPRAKDDELITDEDTRILVEKIGLLANDKDRDGRPKVVKVSEPQHGILTDNSDGTYTYTPDENYFGSDSFTYTISDGEKKDTANVSITVNPVNDEPVAQGDTYTIDEDTQIMLTGLLSNDSDVDMDSLSIVSTTAAQHGTLTDNQDGTYTYTPDENYFGSDSFMYTISDGEKKDTANVSITVNPVNDEPVAQGDTYTTDEDTQIILTGLLSNDSDVDMDSLSIVSTTAVQHGTLTDNQDGTYTYTPDAEYSGSDGFIYTVSDGKKEAAAEVSITVANVNDVPEAQNDSFTTDEDTQVVISGLLANDTDKESETLSIVSTTAAQHGTLTDNQDGTYTYTPDTDYFGNDSFNYTVSDGGEEDTAEVNITIASINDAPVAQNDVFIADEDTQVIISGLLDNDTDIESDALSIVSTTAPSHGSLSDNGNGTYTYAPDVDYHGGDSFTYTISDGDKQDVAEVNITVNSINGAPVAVDDAFLINQNSVLDLGEGSLLGNDTDEEKDPLTIVAVIDPGNGTLQDDGDGTYTYTPNADYYGPDSFTYTISDGTETDTAIVTITVNALPITSMDRYSASAYNPSTKYFSVMSNDSDPDGDTLTIVRVWGGSASKSISGNRIRYSTIPYYLGWDTFYYEVSDGRGGIKKGTVKVTYGY